jgi:hypothetical protein
LRQTEKMETEEESHMKKKAEPRGMQPPVQVQLRPPESGRDKKGLSP